MRYIILYLLVMAALVLTPKLRRNGGRFDARYLKAIIQQPQVVLAVGDQVSYPDRNGQRKVARVVGFHRSRAMLHVGHPNHSDFSRPIDQLDRVH